MVSFSATANGDVSGTLRDFTSSGGDSCRSGGVDSMDSHLSIRLNRSFKPRGIRSSTSKDAVLVRRTFPPEMKNPLPLRALPKICLKL